jgi:ABC-type transport system involved in multi-copper enzyme maturation permease subunit
MNGPSAANRPPRDWRAKLINPVLGKEFTLRMRTPRSMWALLFYLIAIGILAFGMLFIFRLDYGLGAGVFDPSRSRTMFLFVSIAQLGLIAFMTPGLTAGVISGEREKQTLNLLLVTQQSNSSIILSKLVSSLAFMTLLVIATMPIFSVVFLYGGISPGQVGTVFAFYLFTMLAFGSFGILFSTLMKRTMLSVIASYGLTLFLYGGTAFLYLVLGLLIENLSANQTNPPGYYGWIGYLLGLNPAAALVSIFEPEFSDSMFRAGLRGRTTGAPIELWQEYFIVYAVLTVIAILLSIRHIRPVRKRKRKKGAGNG